MLYLAYDPGSISLKIIIIIKNKLRLHQYNFLIVGPRALFFKMISLLISRVLEILRCFLFCFRPIFCILKIQCSFNL